MVAEKNQVDESVAQDDDDWVIPSFNQSNGKGTVEVPQIEPGLYVVEVGEIGKPYVVEDPKFNPNGNKRKFTIDWVVVADASGDTEQAGYKVRAWYTVSMHEKSNLYKVAKALFGGDLDPSEPISPAMILGKRAMGYISFPELTDEDIRDGKLAWPRIDNFLPVPKTRGKQKSEDGKDIPF